MSFWHDPEGCRVSEALAGLGAPAQRAIWSLDDGITPDAAAQVLYGCWDLIFVVADAISDSTMKTADFETADSLRDAREAMYACLRKLDLVAHTLEDRAEAVRQEEASA